jgi:hypothetical protein
MFPPHDEFAQIPFNSINQENFSIPSQSTSESSLHKNLFNKKRNQSSLQAKILHQYHRMMMTQKWLIHFLIMI